MPSPTVARGASKTKVAPAPGAPDGVPSAGGATVVSIAPGAKPEREESDTRRRRGRPPAPPEPYPGVAFPLKEAAVEEIPVERMDLDDDTFQMRLAVRPEDMVESVRHHGIQVPVTLRPHPRRKGKYQIVSGFRRIRAALLSDLGTVPAVVRGLTDEEAYVHAFAENEYRRSLRPLDRAVAIAKLRAAGDLTTPEIGRLYRLSSRQVQRLEGLLAYPPDLVEALDEERISTTHALVLQQAKKKLTTLDFEPWIDRIDENRWTCEELRVALKRDVSGNGDRPAIVLRKKNGTLVVHAGRAKDASAEERDKAVDELEAVLCELKSVK